MAKVSTGHIRLLYIIYKEPNFSAVSLGNTLTACAAGTQAKKASAVSAPLRTRSERNSWRNVPRGSNTIHTSERKSSP